MVVKIVHLILKTKKIIIMFNWMHKITTIRRTKLLKKKKVCVVESNNIKNLIQILYIININYL